MQLPFGPIRVHNAVDHNRHGSRPLIKSKIIAIGSGVSVLPLGGSGPRVEGFDHLPIVEAMKENHAVLDDDRTTEPLTDLFPPDRSRATGRPRLDERWTVVHAITVGAEELRPVTIGTIQPGGKRHRSHKCEDKEELSHKIAYNGVRPHFYENGK